MKLTVVLALVLTLVLSACSLPGMPAATATLPHLPPVATKAAPLNTLPPMATFTKAASNTPEIAIATKAPGGGPTPAATLAPPTATASVPTQPPATNVPTVAPTKAPTKAPTQVPPTAAASAKEGKIYMIAIGDNGVSGKKIGCGDSAVGVIVTLSNPSAPLRSVLEKLLAVQSQNYGQSGLYNALFRSDLQLQSVTIKNGVADIYLTGSLTLGGVCDNPRVQAQFEETALQFSTVNKVNVYINNKNLLDLLSLK